MADTDPPDEVDDREAPRHWLRDGPDAHASEEEPGERDHQHSGSAAGDAEHRKPTQRRVRREHDARDLLGDRPEGLARPYDPKLSGFWINPGIAGFDFAGCHRGFNPLPARAPPALLQV